MCSFLPYTYTNVKIEWIDQIRWQTGEDRSVQRWWIKITTILNYVDSPSAICSKASIWVDKQT